MNRLKKFSSVFFILLLLSCDTVENIVGDLNVFSDEDDKALGAQVSAEIESNPQEYPIYNNPEVKNYIVQNIFNPILQSSKIEKENVYNYHLELIDDDNTLNAFALPGGPVYLYTGLIKYLDSEAALAGVLGHEIAHAEERHATERMTTEYGVSFLLSLVIGENASDITQIAANLFTGLALLQNSRSDEDQSDLRSFEYLQDTKYYPGGVKFFFEKLEAENLANSGDAGLERFLETHPQPVDRISNTNERLQAAGLPVYSYTSDAQGVYRDSYYTNILSKMN